MPAPAADRLFERFRATRDPRVLGRLFDRTAPELFRVALYLTGDRDAADDAVQDTFVTAIESADAHVRGQPVLPWLLGILANRVREARRRARRVPDPAQLQRGADAPASERAASAEFEALLDRALGELDAPYREVVTLHVRHGMTAKEIGAALGRPAGTVRTQIVRGLERLRGLLPRGFAASGAAALAGAALAPRVRAAVLDHALRHAPVGATAAGGSLALAAVGIGGLLTMKKLFAAVGVVTFLAVGWFAWPAFAPSAPVADADARTAEPEAAALGDRIAVRAPEEVEVAQSRVAVPVAEAPAATGAIELEFVWAGDEAPVANASLFVRAYDDDRRLLDAIWRTDASGSIRRAGLEPELYQVSWYGSGRVDVEVRADETTHDRLILEPDTDVTGRVLDPGGVPVADAELWGGYLRGQPELARPELAGRAAADGTFRVRSLWPTMLWASAAGYGASDARSVDEEMSIELRLTTAGPPVSGRVVDPDGRPVNAAEVLAIPRWRAVSARTRPPLRWVTRPDGTFVTDRLAAEEHVFVATAPGFALGHRIVDVAAAPPPIALRLPRGATWTGQVRFADEPIAASIEFLPAWATLEGGFSYAWNLLQRRFVTDESGRFEATGLAPGAGRFVVLCSKFPSHEGTIDLVDGETTHQDVILAASAATTVRGRVLGPDGEALEGWEVRTAGDYTETDADGRFTLEGLDPEHAPFALHVAPHGRPRFGWADVVEAAAGADDVVIRARHRYDDHARIRGRAVDSDGRPVSDALVYLRNVVAAGEQARETSKPAGSFQWRVAPGRYQIRVDFADATSTDAGTHDLRPGQQLDLGDIAPPQRSRFAIRLVDARGEFHVPSRLAVAGAGGHAVFPAEPTSPPLDHLGDGWYRTPELGVGRFTVWMRGATFAPTFENIEVGPGGESRFTLRVEAAQSVRFTFAGLGPGDADGMVHLAWSITRIGAEPVPIGSPLLLDVAEPSMTYGFEPGRYVVEAGPEDDRVQTTFEVPAVRSATPIPVGIDFGR